MTRAGSEGMPKARQAQERMLPCESPYPSGSTDVSTPILVCARHMRCRCCGATLLHACLSRFFDRLLHVFFLPCFSAWVRNPASDAARVHSAITLFSLMTIVTCAGSKWQFCLSVCPWTKSKRGGIWVMSRAPRDPAAWTHPCPLCTSCTCPFPDCAGRCSPPEMSISSILQQLPPAHRLVRPSEHVCSKHAALSQAVEPPVELHLFPFQQPDMQRLHLPRVLWLIPNEF